MTAELRVFARKWLYTESKWGEEGNEDMRVSDSENVVNSLIPIKIWMRDCLFCFIFMEPDRLILNLYENTKGQEDSVRAVLKKQAGGLAVEDQDLF